MTVKGWTWYQGENDMFEVKGNSNAKVGYSCMMKALVQQWRSLWSATPNTTAPGACNVILSLIAVTLSPWSASSNTTTLEQHSYLFQSNRQVPNSICGLPLKFNWLNYFNC